MKKPVTFDDAPPPADGRSIDQTLGRLAGEGAAMEVARPGAAPPLPLDERDPSGGPSYYGLPLLQAPVWKPLVPLYYWIGGAAGASATLALAARLAGGPRLQRLGRHARWLAAAGDAAGAALLIADLGRPARFLNMLRVFRPSSPMSVGSWVLSLSGAANGAAALLEERRGLPGAVGRLAGVAGGLLGMPLAGYTAVLVANTAVPIWLATRRSLPLVFISSGVASAGAALSLTARSPAERRATTVFAVAGQAAELAATVALHAEAAGEHPRVGRPLRRGRSGALFAAAAALSAASLLTALVARRRPARVAGALLGLGGTLALRFAVHEAGVASARDPHATFAQQRR